MRRLAVRASAARGVVRARREDESAVQTLVRADLEAEIWSFVL